MEYVHGTNHPRWDSVENLEDSKSDPVPSIPRGLLSHTQVSAPIALIQCPGMFKCLTFALRENPLVYRRPADEEESRAIQMNNEALLSKQIWIERFENLNNRWIPFQGIILRSYVSYFLRKESTTLPYQLFNKKRAAKEKREINIAEQPPWKKK